MDKETRLTITKIGGMALLGGGLLAIAMKSSGAKRAIQEETRERKKGEGFILGEIAKLKADLEDLRRGN